MRFTRHALNGSVQEARIWFMDQERLGTNSSIYTSAVTHLRSKAFTIDFNQLNRMLHTNHIHLIYDDVNKHWAETDGSSIWLNTWRTWTHSALTLTLIHEAIHNLVLRDGKHTLPEEKEHAMMAKISQSLID